MLLLGKSNAINFIITDYNKQCFSPAYFKIRRLNDPHLSIIQIDRNAIPKKIQKGFS
jgi:hypothetical protein